MTHKVLNAYIRMALGLPLIYALETANEDAGRVLNGGRPSMIEPAWDSSLIDRICKARNMSRERFIRTMAAPKPSIIANLIFYDELVKTYGDISSVPGFETGPIRWPSSQGLIVPIREKGKITRLAFYRLSEVLRPKVKV